MERIYLEKDYSLLWFDYIERLSPGLALYCKLTSCISRLLGTGVSSHRAAYQERVRILMREVVARRWVPGIYTRVQAFPNIHERRSFP
jgi:hypothetical protein